MPLDNMTMAFPDTFDESALRAAPARAPFDELTLAFLNAVSRRLMQDTRSRAYPDVVTLAFWLRRGSLEQLKRSHAREKSGQVALGRGIVFHIAPGNVAVNFAYSLAAGLLAGNNNIVKLATRSFPQTDIILDALRAVCALPEYAAIAQGLAIVRYSADDAATTFFSSLCDIRVIWGGDATVDTIRRIPLPPRSTEVLFADRTAYCAIKAGALLAAGDLATLARGFYNDTYLMDQNACSSPRMVAWQGTADEIAAAKARFWPAVHTVVQQEYTLASVLAVDKYTRLLEDTIRYDGIRREESPDNLITRVHFPTPLPPDIGEVRSAGGYFVEADISSLDELAPIIDRKVQTLTHFGFSPEELAGFVTRNALPGIDRIVPIGQAMAFDLVWDGYDLTTTLSRVCAVSAATASVPE